VGNGNGVSRGDRNRNAKLARLRELVPVQNVIIGIDLADKKQMVVVCDLEGARAAHVPVPGVGSGCCVGLGRGAGGGEGVRRGDGFV